MKWLVKLSKGTFSLYRPDYLHNLVVMLQASEYGVMHYLGRYWTTQDFRRVSGIKYHRTTRNYALTYFLYFGALFQAMLGVVLLNYGLYVDIPGIVPFGLAIIISYPIVWAHTLGISYGAFKTVWSVLHPKKAGRWIVCGILKRQVVQLRRKHQFYVIAVTGSVGKTSTKLAIAHLLEPSRRVIYQTGNYNDPVTVPLVLFGHNLPGLFNIFAWTKIFLANERTIARPRFYDIAVVELGTDHPGTIRQFAYLQPELSVVTAVTPEHMEFFGNLDAVAEEELAVCDYSAQVLVNADDTPAKYLSGRKVLTYGLGKQNDFRASGYKAEGLKGGKVKLELQDGVMFETRAAILGEQGVKILLGAAASGQLAGLSEAELKKGVAEVKPFAGRMQVLPGVKGSTIIDDSYNASPAAVESALDVLYAAKAPQRIAILGNMNELGDYSREAHEEVGRYCRKDKLDLVVTIGSDAEKYLAPAAREKGCYVETFSSPYDAGQRVLQELKKGAVVLAEGSQNRVFAEESLKALLADRTDTKKLVRQSAYWMSVKRKQFGEP